MSECYLSVPADAAVRCDNCDWSGTGEQLEMVRDIQERLTPGGIVPAGQCPQCGALAYVPDTPEAKVRAFVERLAALTTPYDDMEKRKKRHAREYGMDVADVDEDDVIADYSGDDAFEEAQAFWRLIVEARELGKPTA